MKNLEKECLGLIINLSGDFPPPNQFILYFSLYFFSETLLKNSLYGPPSNLIIFDKS